MLGFEIREAIEDERVGLIGQFSDERQVIPAEAVGVVEVPGVVQVGPGEGHVVEFLLFGLVLPHGGLDAAKAEVFTGSLALVVVLAGEAG